MNKLTNVIIVLAIIGAIAVFYLLIDFLGGYGAIISAMIFAGFGELCAEKVDNKTKQE